MKVTVIIPCYRSEQTLRPVVQEIKSELGKRPGNEYQVILVNDCSPDGTFAVIRELVEEDENILGLNLGRNFGQNNARMAAVPYITGDVAVCMDDDGQHPADQIYRLVDKVEEGYDLVYAHFGKQRQPLFRRVASRAHTWVQEQTGAKQKGIYNSPFLAWSSYSIRALRAYHSPFVSAGAYLMRMTNRVANIEVKQRPRASGHSGYTLKKLLNLWLTEFTNFSLVPLRASGIVGALFALAGLLWALFLVVQKIVYPEVQAGYTSIMAAVLLVGGIILLMLGLLGEYVGKLYMTISNLPQYAVRDVVGKVPHENMNGRTVMPHENGSVRL